MTRPQQPTVDGAFRQGSHTMGILGKGRAYPRQVLPKNRSFPHHLTQSLLELSLYGPIPVHGTLHMKAAFDSFVPRQFGNSNTFGHFARPTTCCVASLHPRMLRNEHGKTSRRSPAGVTYISIIFFHHKEFVSNRVHTTFCFGPSTHKVKIGFV
jgi:hypothetical protein